MYYDIPGGQIIADAEGLSLQRAKRLVAAIQENSDFELISIRQRRPADGGVDECIIVDVECHNVPSRNKNGIRFKERLALLVPADTKQLIQVYSLRKDFPILIHQNQSRLGSPAALCLYFESPPEVLRTWTPEKFLRRIQWWLEKSARGELHPTDQPVEHLFFFTKFEIVLPWNYEDLRNDPSRQFLATATPTRNDGGFTILVSPAPLAQKQDGKHLSIIELDLPPILHGQVEQNPTSLGELEDILTARGTTVIPLLRSKSQELIPANGVQKISDGSLVVVLIRIPMLREEGRQAEKVTHRAFLLKSGLLSLGQIIGSVMEYQGRFFKDVLKEPDNSPQAPWRSYEIFPLEVSNGITPEVARAQSGIPDAGPNATLIGAGSLGSALLNVWGRSGWGRWTVIDNDHIKTHNLVRHVAHAEHVGYQKVNVVAHLQQATMLGSSPITPICADACSIALASGETSLTKANLVIDASTTLEYPRLVSTQDHLARHMTIFITPNGNSCVLLSEDANRQIRLRSLEAQYYRALIQEPWGEQHLSTESRGFWSGTSCRDISMVLPYARIVGHAGNLAEQVQSAWQSESAQISIWSRNPARGDISAHSIAVYPERSYPIGEMSLFIDDGLSEKLRDFRRSASPLETGGILLGYYDFNIGMVVVVDALPAPTDSKATGASFERGIAGLTEAVRQASLRTAGIVGYIGEWHSHPPGHSANPSRDDMIQLVELALGMSADGLPAISLIVGENDIQFLKGELRR